MRTAIAAVACLTFAQVSFAQEKTEKAERAEKPAAGKAEKAPAMTAPKPGPELDALKPLGGNWSCDGKAPAGPMGPAHSYKASFTNKWDLGNFWIWSEYDVKKSKENPLAFTGKGWIGYDSANKHYVWAGVDNMGGWISLTSSGWEGDKLTWEGDGMGPNGKTKMKFTFTKGKTPTDISLEYAAQDNKGAWESPTTETCKKR